MGWTLRGAGVPAYSHGLDMNDKPTDQDVPPAAPEPPTVADIDVPDADIDRYQAELETMKDRHLRLQADFDNFRRRTQRERVDLQVRANEELIRELLPVLDHFELGLKTAAEHSTEGAVVDGFQMVYDQLCAALKRSGLVAVDASGVFDPHQHEAVTHVPSAELPADTIVQQTRRGYRLGERLLRPAQVVVSSGPPPTAEG